MKTLKIALVGNSNTGKSSFLNTLTGSKRQTSNYHGTTVDIFSSEISYKGINFKITDLPGIYGFDNYTDEEKVTKNSLEKDDYDILVQLIDTNHKKRSLSLTFELMKLNKPLLLVFNRKIEACVHCNLIDEIEKEIGVPGIELNVLEKNANSLFFEKVINLKHKVNHGEKVKKILNGDESKKNRFNFIEKKFEKHFPKNLLLNGFTEKIDRFLLNKFIGIPFFLFLMWAIFELTFTIGAYPMDIFDSFISYSQDYLGGIIGDGIFSSLIIDGIIGGVGAVLIFLWPILILFFFLNLIQESGYLARIAFLLENLMARFGLTGKSFVPLLMGFGCNVPAIMAIRTLGNTREKIITAMMIPFMSCGARLPVYTILLAAFVEEKWRGTILFGLYLFGVIVSFISGFFLNKFLKGKKKELFIELPAYKMPSIKKAFRAAFQKGMMYLKKAGVIILPLVLLTWFLFSFPQNANLEETYGAKLGQGIEFIFEPLGFDWKISTALIAGLGAKEVFINVLATLYALDEGDESGLINQLQSDPIFSLASVASLLIFMLLYAPCIAVIGVLRQELGNKWALFGLIYPTLIAWILAFIVYRLLL